MINLKTFYLFKIIILIMNETNFFTYLQILNKGELQANAVSTDRSKLHRKKIVHVNCDLDTNCCLTPCVKPQRDLSRKAS